MAQERVDSVALVAGSGISLATGQATSLANRTPLFVDVAYRGWNSEDPSFAWGASVRAEFEGRTSLALVPRAELSTTVGPLTVRPGVAAPLFFAPFTLLGVEGSLTARLALTEGLGIVAAFMADAFFLGGDLPDGSLLLMFNGTVGVDLVL